MGKCCDHGQQFTDTSGARTQSRAGLWCPGNRHRGSIWGRVAARGDLPQCRSVAPDWTASTARHIGTTVGHEWLFLPPNGPFRDRRQPSIPWNHDVQGRGCSGHTGRDDRSGGRDGGAGVHTVRPLLGRGQRHSDRTGGPACGRPRPYRPAHVCERGESLALSSSEGATP